MFWWPSPHRYKQFQENLRSWQLQSLEEAAKTAAQERGGSGRIKLGERSSPAPSRNGSVLVLAGEPSPVGRGRSDISSRRRSSLDPEARSSGSQGRSESVDCGNFSVAEMATASDRPRASSHRGPPSTDGEVALQRQYSSVRD